MLELAALPLLQSTYPADSSSLAVLNFKRCRCICALEAGAPARPRHVPVIWPRTGCKPSSCRPGVTVFLVEAINLKPCCGTCQVRGRRGGGRAGHMPVIWSRTGSHWLQAWLGVVVQCYCFALQQYGDARCGPLTAGQQLAAEAGSGKGHSNNLNACMAVAPRGGRSLQINKLLSIG